MVKAVQFWFSVTLALAVILTLSLAIEAQSSAATVYHQIEGRLRIDNNPGVNVRVRLMRETERRPIAETFSRSRGEFEFRYVTEGDYIIETFETNQLEASSTILHVRPFPREIPTVFRVDIDISVKVTPARKAPGVVMADVDINVPKEAVTHYRNGLQAMEVGDGQRALKEFRQAIKIFPEYYAARLELGRDLRLEKRFSEAEEALGPLTQIAPKHAEVWIENGIVLLELQRRDNAAEKLRVAVLQEETNWAAHLYLGWALLEEHPAEAEPHFKRAIELDEAKAARAHLALARLADANGQRQLAIQHLEAYLLLAPDAPDVQMTRQLAERLRKSNP